MNKIPSVTQLTSQYKKLCTPAMLYFTISILSLLFILLQNLGNSKSFHIVSFSAQLLYMLFWTWILNLICKDKHTNVAWLLVLMPYIILGIIVIGLPKKYR